MSYCLGGGGLIIPGLREELQDNGGRFLLSYLPAILTVSLCYGILIPIAATVVYNSAKHQSHTWHSRWQLAIICLGITAFSVHSVLRVGQILLELLSVVHSSESYGLGYFTLISQSLQIWLECIPPIINDAFIIWRAWVIFEKQRWTLYISVALCLATSGFTIVYLSTHQRNGSDMLVFYTAFAGVALQQFTTVILSLVTNLVATSFIGRMLWSHIKFLHKNINSHQYQQFKSWHVLYLLIDAGAAYVVLQAIYLVVIVAAQQNGLGSLTIAICIVLAELYICFSFVYPALTIALIHGPLSIVNVHETVISLQMLSPAV